MRLVSLDIAGFRGFPQQHTIDLDADAVVIVGANGHGKTSLYDSVLWALTGRVPRLLTDDASLVSMYSESGQARVALRLRNKASEEVTVTRSSNGETTRLTLETLKESIQGPLAEGRLMDLIWPDVAAASEPADALATVLTRSVYLQQDLIRQFVEAATDQERFAAVSELIGAGRVTELQADLEKSKRAWTTATNQKMSEVRPLIERLAIIDARLAEVSARANQGLDTISAQSWDEWWQSLSSFRIAVQRVDSGSREAPVAIDAAIKGLDAIRRATERRLQDLRAVATDLVKIGQSPSSNLTPLNERVDAARKEVESAKGLVAEEQQRLAELRRLQAGLLEKDEQLKALASLAMKQLDDHCPVCAQDYDKDATKKRLQSIVSGTASPPEQQPQQDKLPLLLQTLTTKEKQLAEAEAAHRTAEQAVTRFTMARDGVSKRLKELGIEVEPTEAITGRLEQASREAEERLLQLAALQRGGESLALRLGQTAAAKVSEQLRREGEGLRREIGERERVVAARNQTGEKAQQVIEALRVAASAVVEDRLNEITPLLQSIYARIDPHPAFRAVAFLSHIVRGKGQLSTVVSDPVTGKECDQPATVLSSSQVNALAVSVFLALNIGIPNPPLQVAMLDDPIQSLDDINLLGLVDLLRRAKDRRQLIVSTHDTKFGSLLARKLRPAGKGGRTVVVELDGWSRKGPRIYTREVQADPEPHRLMANAV